MSSKKSRKRLKRMFKSYDKAPVNPFSIPKKRKRAFFFCQYCEDARAYARHFVFLSHRRTRLVCDIHLEMILNAPDIYGEVFDIRCPL